MSTDQCVVHPSWLSNLSIKNSMLFMHISCSVSKCYMDIFMLNTCRHIFWNFWYSNLSRRDALFSFSSRWNAFPFASPTDVNECVIGSHNCDSTEFSVCTNYNGSFGCSCLPGTYSGSGTISNPCMGKNVFRM